MGQAEPARSLSLGSGTIQPTKDRLYLRWCRLSPARGTERPQAPGMLGPQVTYAPSHHMHSDNGSTLSPISGSSGAPEPWLALTPCVCARSPVLVLSPSLSLLASHGPFLRLHLGGFHCPQPPGQAEATLEAGWQQFLETGTHLCASCCH